VNECCKYSEMTRLDFKRPQCFVKESSSAPVCPLKQKSSALIRSHPSQSLRQRRLFVARLFHISQYSLLTDYLSTLVIDRVPIPKAEDSPLKSSRALVFALVLASCGGGQTESGLTPSARGGSAEPSPTGTSTATPSAGPAASTAPSTKPPASPTTTPSPVPTATATPAIKHITVVVMENYNYEEVLGSSQAPFINSFAAASALFTNSEAITHPSEPNYLALFSGSTQGDTTDDCPLSYSAANLATELSAKHLTFAGYAEDYPSANPYACEYDPSPYASGYYYMRKHVPWTDFTNFPTSEFHAYTDSAPQLSAQVTFITPNMCDDMHDCPISSGDAWASKNLPAIESWDNANDGLLILTFDEGDNSPTNHILTVFAGPMVASGQYGQSINHYSIVRFIEKNFGLPYLGGAASQSDITGVVK
jgi:phosphatidylinositol-3-phosphatase